MTLTKENMKTDSTGNIWSIDNLRRDLYTMDESQLVRYVNGAFTGQGDYSFLPMPFWEYFFDINGDNSGRRPQQPTDFFSGEYNLIPAIESGRFTNSDGTKIYFDPKYRQRFESVLIRIMEQCLNPKTKATEKNKKLAYSLVVVSETIRDKEEGAREYENSSEEPNKIIFELARYIRDDSRYSNIHFDDYLSS